MSSWRLGAAFCLLGGTQLERLLNLKDDYEKPDRRRISRDMSEQNERRLELKHVHQNLIIECYEALAHDGLDRKERLDKAIGNYQGLMLKRGIQPRKESYIIRNFNDWYYRKRKDN